MGLHGELNPGTATAAPSTRRAVRDADVTPIAWLLGHPLCVMVWGVETKSEMNRRDHHMARYRRFKGQKEAVAVALMDHRHLLAAVGDEVNRHGGEVTITLTRLGAKPLDSDNLAGSMKAIRDEVAKAMEIDDGCPRLRWEYDQRRGEPGVIVQIERRA